MAVLAVTLVAFLLVAVLGVGGEDAPSFERGTVSSAELEPLGWAEDREDELEARAAAGHSQVLYAKSPGGAAASAARTARWRKQVESAAEAAGVDPDLVEGMVLLESAGRPDAVAGDLEGAVGLTQILAETGSGLLGMRVDVAQSRRLTKAIGGAEARGDTARARRLRAQRARVDERFDPRKALAATGRYLKLARDRLGREDLAVESYHMGMGNLQGLIDAYGEEDAEDLSYTRLYFDVSPRDHPRAYRLMSRLGDDSATYFWRVRAAAEIMRLHREDPDELARLARLHTAKNSAEEVLHPEGETEVFDGAEMLEQAYDEGELRPFPDDPARLGLRRDPRMGELASRLDRERTLYRGLRPEAFALAAAMAAETRRQSGTNAPLIVTSTVRDRDYQRLLVGRNAEATANYSLHTTGWTLDVRRRYRSPAQAEAFQFTLDRLQSLNLIAWVREPGAIHITASSDASSLLSLLDEG